MLKPSVGKLLADEHEDREDDDDNKKVPEFHCLSSPSRLEKLAEKHAVQGAGDSTDQVESGKFVITLS